MENRVISMFYELKDKENNEILETNFQAEPIKFITGLGHVLEKLEKEVLNLRANEEKIIQILKDESAIEYNPGGVRSFPKEEFAGIELKEGMELIGEGEDGRTARVIVKSIGDDEVVVDFNHPYAGKDLEFKVKIVENRLASEDEVKNQRVEGEHVCGCGDHEDHECCGGHHHEDHECCGGHHHHNEDDECCGRHK